MTGARPHEPTAAGVDGLSGPDRHATPRWGGRAPAVLFLCLGFAATVIPARLSLADFADAAAAYDGGDVEAAADEWRRLAKRGDPQSQVALADLYMAGQGVPQDRSRARALYREAASAGNRVAQINLGEIYLRGLGVRPDAVRAYAWFKLAAAQGSGWAADRLQFLRARLSDEQLAAGETLADAFAGGHIDPPGVLGRD